MIISPENLKKLGHAASDVGQIAAGGIIGGIGLEGAKALLKARKKKSDQQDMNALRRRLHQFSGWGNFAKGAGIIAIGDAASDATLDQLKHKKRRALLIKKGIEQNTAVPGPGPTSFDYDPETTDLDPEGEEDRKDGRTWLAKNKWKAAGTAGTLAGSLLLLRKRVRGSAPIGVARPPMPTHDHSALLQKVHEFEISRRDHRGRNAVGTDIHTALRVARPHVIRARRGGEVVQDIADDLSGKKREGKRKKFYEKKWAQNAALTGVVGLGVLAGRHYAIRNGHPIPFSALHKRVKQFGAMFVQDPNFPPTLDHLKKPDPELLKESCLKPQMSVSEWKKRRIQILQRETQWSTLRQRVNEFQSIPSALAEDAVEALAKINTKKRTKPPTKDQLAIANQANPDPGLVNNNGLNSSWRNSMGMETLRGRVNEFYGTSAGVAKAWDSRGRNESKKHVWWTHSPTKNSVRVVKSSAELGPRNRRKKKGYEKTSFHKKAIVAAGLAASPG